MLNLCELNGYLYQHLDREAKKKEMVRNYGSYLMHSKDNSAKPNITEQANSWLAHFAEMINDEKSDLNKSAASAKIAAEAMIPECSKILRKVNAQKAGKDLAQKLAAARKSLEDIRQAAVAHSAMEEQEHVEHGIKWKKHKYIDIRNGRYIYPEDYKRTREGKVVLGDSYDLMRPETQGVSKNVANKFNNLRKETKRINDLQNIGLSKESAWKNYGYLHEDAKKELDNAVKAEKLKKDAKAAETATKATRETVLSDIMKSEAIQNYAKAIAEFYVNGLIKWNGDENSADFDITSKDMSKYGKLQDLANKAEEYAKAAGAKSNGAIDWPEIRKELEENLLRKEINKYMPIKHSAFEISNEEMEAFLAKRGKSITT